jgi:nitrile hydratase
VTQRFAVGDVVRTRAARLEGHTRLPRYLERRRGRVEAVHGTFALADDRAEGAAGAPQVLYGVVFDGAEVWGAGAASLPMTIAADLWDAYLDPESR